MSSFDAARALAENLLAAQRPDLWARAQRAAIRARELAGETGADLDLLMTAAVLHPIGCSPVVRRTGDQHVDAGRFLRVRGHDPRVVELVAGRGAEPTRRPVVHVGQARPYTETWKPLVAVNGSPHHPPHRCRSSSPARRAIRSSSLGHT